MVRLKDIRYFFFGQELSDGLRITIGILLPALAFASYSFEMGLTISLGALCVSISDVPGPVRHKRNAMLLSTVLVTVSALATAFACLNIFILGAEILIFSFFFSMFTVYGARAAAVGSGVLVMMILNLDNHMTLLEIFEYAALVAFGGLWYIFLSLVFGSFNVYRPSQRALGECIHEMVKFMNAKAAFYETGTNLDEDYNTLVNQHARVSEKQDIVRELLFKTRVIVQESTEKGRELIYVFVTLVDVFEDISAMYYDYGAIREKFGATGILDEIASLIREMGTNLDDIGFAIHSNTSFKNRQGVEEKLAQLKQRIDALPHKEGNTIVLAKIFVNLRVLAERITYLYTHKPLPAGEKKEAEYKNFTSKQDYSPSLFFDNLSLSSSIFKHAVRVALASIAGFVVSKIIGPQHHSYWILLTILVIMKPSFSLTKKRNGERLLGTILGGIIGVIILFYIHDRIVLLVILMVFMLITYSFQRLNYIVMVIFMTPFILIFFYFLGKGQLVLAEDRVLDTAIGSLIAFLVSYLLFPHWEARQIKTYLQKVLAADIGYLQKLLSCFSGNELKIQDYKLLRKEVYVSAANLSAAFQHMISEPRSKQQNKSEIQQFIVLNHILSSNVSAVFIEFIKHKTNVTLPTNDLKTLKRSIAILEDNLKKLDESYTPLTLEKETGTMHKGTNLPPNEIIRDQLDFILKLCGDAGKIVGVIGT